MTYTIGNDAVRATIEEKRGGEVSSLRFRGQEVLFVSEGLGRRLQDPTFEESRTAWLEGYDGGWQEILPNPGEARSWYGAEQSFHGELSRAVASAVESGPSSIDLEFLLASGLSVSKSMRVLRDGLRVESSVGGRDGRDVPWLHHPIFPADIGTRLSTGDEAIDDEVNEFLRSDRDDSRVWEITDSRGSVDLVGDRRVSLRWDPLTWPALWIWVGSDGGRRFIGIEPSSCSTDGRMMTGTQPSVPRGWIEVLVR